MQPVNLKVMSKGSYDVEIGWMHGGHYKEVFYSNITCIEEKSKQRTLKIDGQNNTHKIKNLKPFTNYTFTVITCVQVTKNLVLCSDPSKKLLVTTDIAGNFCWFSEPFAFLIFLCICYVAPCGFHP